MNMEIFSWVLVALSLTGNIFVVKKNVVGQWLWALSNIGWITYDLSIGAWSQATLFGVYFALCIWGIVSWSKESKPQAKPA